MSGRHLLSTFSGKQFDLDLPEPDQISLEDIASALSKICRFGAQTREFLSVAQHAVMVQTLVVEAGRSDLALAALHHDSHEAYACDIPTPVKRKLGMDHRASEYANLCRALDVAICRALDFLPVSDRDDKALMKRADEQARLAEARSLLHDRGAAVCEALLADGVDPDQLALLVEVVPLAPEEARIAFIRAHKAHS